MSQKINYLLIQIILLTMYNKSMLKNVDSLKKKPSKFYLSDVMKKFENKNSSYKPLVNKNPFSQNTKTDLTNQDQNGMENSSYNEHASHLNMFSQYKSSTSASYCEPSYKKYQIKIGDECETFNYSLVECNGYCRSLFIIWKNHDDIQTVSCCTMTAVTYKLNKIYCLKRLDSNEIKNDLYQKIRDDEVYQLFKESLSKTSWTDHLVYKGKHLYAGYYTVKTFHDATCECQYI